ncbi:meiotic recombination protein REC114 isoform X2 [Heptranchias perlo]|uniref:meiotic recombination protein REC114 isoform X2 n=1 Tax=Heptranchias perlo TaxID=212740 RepID=UPI003559DAF2
MAAERSPWALRAGAEAEGPGPGAGAERRAGQVPPDSRSEAALANTQWALKRYARFTPPGGASSSWEVFESSQEKGLLSLTIVQSGHFLISQGGATLLEGFSLIEAHKWWKAVRRADCVLFGSKVKNESRMFRVQFSGDSHGQALEHCSSCVQKLLQYVDVQNPEGKNLNQALLLSQTTNISHSGTTELESMLGAASPQLPLAYQQSALNTEELGPFLRLCLMDQSFPAFVQQVEHELKKLVDE